MVSNDILQRLQNARKPREKPEPLPKGRNAPLKRGAAPKQRTPVKKRSEKMKVIVSALVHLYPVFLESRPDCEIKSPDCTGAATVVNHNQGRGIKEVLDQRKWTPCCPACNSWIEIHHEEAKEMGFKVSRHKKS